MATATLIPVEEYLRTSYRPDCDFLDGEVRERNLGERPHALLQGIFYATFRERRRDWRVVALPEQRVEISRSRYRIPDVCVVWASDPVNAIVQVAPLLCIEILSKGDTLSELQERVDDYQAMGVEHIWAVDPLQRRGYVASVNGFQRPGNDVFTVPGTPIQISLVDVFAEFDEAQTQA